MPKCFQQNTTAAAALLQLWEEQWSLLTKVMPSAAPETFTEPWHEGHPAPCCTLTRCSCSFTGREMGHVKPLVVEMHPIHYHGNMWKHQDLSYKPRCKGAGGKQVCYWPKLRMNSSVINFHIFCPGDSKDAPWRNPTAQLAQWWLDCTSNVHASTQIMFHNKRDSVKKPTKAHNKTNKINLCQACLTNQLVATALVWPEKCWNQVFPYDIHYLRWISEIWKAYLF